MNDAIKAWFAPGVVIALAVQIVGGVTLINGIDNRATTNERDVTRIETRVGVLEKSGGDTAAKMAVVESQLGYVVESLKRIESRMEARAELPR